MKIVKRKLFEDMEDPNLVIDELGEKPKDSIDIKSASKEDLIADMAQGAAEEGQEIDPDEAEEEVEKIWDAADILPNGSGTGRPSKLEKILQRALNTALDNKEVGIHTNFPNILIYGLAGFGKTAIVEKFCKEHHLNMFECDAKNLDAATVGGIPYPKVDPKTGEISQGPVGSKYWDNLNLPNTVLFLDELNRANGRTIGSLLTLINNHKLPAFIEKPNGQVKVTKTFKNILFTVIAVNPASDVFADAQPLDPATISRNASIYHQKADNREYLNYLTDFYTTILGCRTLTDRLKQKFEGQYSIAKTIVTDKAFHFDDAATVRDTFYASQSDDIYQYLNYRSLTLLLLNFDGTKKDFLEQLNESSNLTTNNINMLKNALAAYTDAPKKGNSAFNTTPTQAQKMAANDINSAIDSFLNSLQ